MLLEDFVTAQLEETTGDEDTLSAVFQDTFDLEGLSPVKDGSLIFLVGVVANRDIKITAVPDGEMMDWIVNGQIALRHGPLGLPLVERQARLRQAILRVGERRTQRVEVGG